MSLNNLPSKIFIYESELDFISRCVMDYPYLETGGDFFGLWTKEGVPVIHYAIGPGKNVERTPAHFNQDIEYLRECGFLLHGKFKLEHLGAWHSHHTMELSEPSAGDVHTMKTAMNNGGFSRFIISICNIEHEEVAVNGFLFSNESLHDYTPCNWEILDGTSPMRESLMKARESLLGLFIEPESEGVSFYVKNTEMPEVQSKHISVKPQFPANSYWTKPEGRQYLKNVFEKMNGRDDLSEVELLQLPDSRVAIAFSHQSTAYEIRFPHNFPKAEPEVIEKVKMNNFYRVILRSGRKQKGKIAKFFGFPEYL